MVKTPFHFRLTLAMTCVLLVVIAQVNPGQASQTSGKSGQINCKEIAVIGAVRRPGRFSTERRVQLLDILTRVGGPTERAGKNIHVIHACSCSTCGGSERKATPSETYNLANVLHGGPSANSYVLPGDIVSVPEDDSVFVIGNVLRPQTFILRERVTITRAIAMAGGVAKNSDLVTVRIIRRS